MPVPHKGGRDPWETEAERNVIRRAGGLEKFKEALRESNNPPDHYSNRWTGCLIWIIPALTIIALIVH